MSYHENNRNETRANSELYNKINEITNLAKSNTFSQLSDRHKIQKLKGVLATIDELQLELKAIRALAQSSLIDIQTQAQMSMFGSKINN